MRSLFVLIAVIMVVGCSESERPAGEIEPDSTSREWVHGSGIVEPASEIRRLSFKRMGLIKEVSVSIGERVDAGQVLITLDNSVETQSLAEAKVRLLLAEALLAELKAGEHPGRIQALEAVKESRSAVLAQSKREYERTQELRLGGAATPSDLEKAEAAYLLALAESNEADAQLLEARTKVRPESISVAEAEVVIAKQRVDAAETILQDMVLRAPFAGTVLDIVKREGEATGDVNSEAVIVFADVTKLRVLAEIDESLALEPKVGQKAEVFGRGLRAEVLSGQLTFLKGVMGKKLVFSRSSADRKDLDVRQVYIDLPAAYDLPIGMEVDVRIRVN
ncbi:MAG: efflux RND transporter periplasmic adaptor subunit [Verrucomicrobiales bacterium]|nr:efflux RND transporter periplasmic adaptor subunit [Verrucomicrobiales bacterium]